MTQPSSIDRHDFQVALGRLIAEPDLNQRFLDDPPAVGQELGLDTGQIEALVSAGLSRLHDFSHASVSKRADLIRKVCPATSELLRQTDQFRRLSRRFVREHPPVETSQFTSRTIRDGFWILDMLLDLHRKGQIENPLVGEVARFERYVLTITVQEEAIASAVTFGSVAREEPELTDNDLLGRCPRRGIHTAIDHFNIDIIEVVRRLSQEEKVECALPCPMIVLFSKQPGFRNVHYANVNQQTADLLELCQGVLSTREIIAKMLRKSLLEKDPESYRISCLNLLTKLARMNVVTFDKLTVDKH